MSMNDHDKSYCCDQWERIKRDMLRSEAKYVKARKVTAKNTEYRRRKEKARRKASKR